MHIYKRWQVLIIAESLLIVLSLTFLAKQSWDAQPVGDADKANQFGQVMPFSR